jgi:hypothetical protein
LISFALGSITLLEYGGKPLTKSSRGTKNTRTGHCLGYFRNQLTLLHSPSWVLATTSW